MTSEDYKKSYWVRIKKSGTHYHYGCYSCKKTVKYHKYPFCPHCGRPMWTDVCLNEKGDVI